MKRASLTTALLVASLALSGPLRAAEDHPTLNLSLDDAVKRALDNNVDIAVQRFNPEASAQVVKQAEGVYDPSLFSTVTQQKQTTPQTSAFTGGATVDTKTTVFNFGVSQNFRTGANFQIQFDNQRQTTNSVFTSFNPFFNSGLTLSLTQPLLKNMKVDANREQIRVAKKNAEISDVQFRQTVINTVANVKKLYFDLIGAMDNLDAQKKSLALAQKLLEENKIKVRVGTLAPLDVVEAQSEVASREEGVIVAENGLAQAQDSLKTAIFPENDPKTWALEIVPTDRPTAEPVDIDLGAAMKKALEERTDIKAAQKNLELAEYSEGFTRNQRLPGVNLIASYGTVGVGGTQIVRDGFGGPIVQTVPGGYGDALSSVFGRDFPTWRVGVNVTYPIRNRSAVASAARAQVARQQAEASLRRLELQVAAEVRSAARAVETNYKRVESTRAARVLQERRLDAEEKKFAAGMSTNFLVTQAQRDLAVAEVAELTAIADYRKSLVDFQRVQEAGVSGSGSVLSVSGGVTGTSGTSTTGTSGTSTTGSRTSF